MSSLPQNLRDDLSYMLTLQDAHNGTDLAPPKQTVTNMRQILQQLVDLPSDLTALDNGTIMAEWYYGISYAYMEVGLFFVSFGAASALSPETPLADRSVYTLVELGPAAINPLLEKRKAGTI